MEGRIYSPIGDQYSSDLKVDGFGNYFQSVKDEILVDLLRTLNTQFMYGSYVPSVPVEVPPIETVKIDLSVVEERITDKYPVGTIVEYDGNDYEVISREDWVLDVGEALELEYLPVVRLDAPEDWEDPYDWYDGLLECHIGRVVELYDEAAEQQFRTTLHKANVPMRDLLIDTVNIEFTVELPKPGPRKPQPRYGWHG